MGNYVSNQGIKINFENDEIVAKIEGSFSFRSSNGSSLVLSSLKNTTSKDNLIHLEKKKNLLKQIHLNYRIITLLYIEDPAFWLIV